MSGIRGWGLEVRCQVSVKYRDPDIVILPTYQTVTTTLQKAGGNMKDKSRRFSED